MDGHVAIAIVIIVKIVIVMRVLLLVVVVTTSLLGPKRETSYSSFSRCSFDSFDFELVATAVDVVFSAAGAVVKVVDGGLAAAVGDVVVGGAAADVTKLKYYRFSQVVRSSSSYRCRCQHHFQQ